MRSADLTAAARIRDAAIEQFGQHGFRLGLRAIAEAIGERLGIPVRGLSAEEATAHFGWRAAFGANDIPASSALTRQSVGWNPTGPGLLEGLRGDYVV